MAISVSWFCIH